MPNAEPYIPRFLRYKLKGATEEQLRQATDNLRRYIKAAYAVYLKVDERRSHADSPESRGDDRFRDGSFKASPKMNIYFGYIRVSTAKQGQHGSSLQEQRDAIEAFAERHHFLISEWFEDRETAAKKGRTQFLRMMTRLEGGKASGVILHKIDRGARNLWDWARIQGLLDSGVEVHFVHDNLDMGSRGGRLAADIQAVVAADYVRNLRDEVLKGQRGRLKQGLYPWGAPLGYRNNGKGAVKTIDPVTGPLVRQAFELYASGQHSFDTLRVELRRRGLARANGELLSRRSFTSILRNPFYAGLLRVKSEHYSGIHEPLIGARLFREVQAVLDGKVKKGPTKHTYLYRKLFTCAACGSTLVGERQIGIVYYRCHKFTCPSTGLREDAISAEFARTFEALRFTQQDRDEMRPLIEEDEEVLIKERAERVKAASVRVVALEERARRLTDLYVDKMIDREAYQSRQETLMLELAAAKQERQQLMSEKSQIKACIEGFFTYLNALRCDNPDGYVFEYRELLKSASSNRQLVNKRPYVTTQWPLGEIAAELAVYRCGHASGASRTFSNYSAVLRILKKYLKEWKPPAQFIVPEAQEKKRLSHWFKPNSPRLEDDQPMAA
jgi:site-specific DNA recombinase